MMQTYQRISERLYTSFDIARMAKATLVVPSDRTVSDVQLDSRLCSSGSLFFAFEGSHSDGFNYLGEVIRKQASAVVVNDNRVWEARKLIEGSGCGLICTTDLLSSFHALAYAYLKQFSAVKTIGVTGSCGKSTTKEAIAAIAAELGVTTKTPGNLNSEFGLPLSLFGLHAQSRYGVFEMGIDHVGEMDRMVELLHPSYAVLTNIGLSHLEKFTSQKILAQEKAKIFHPGIEKGFVGRGCKHLSYIEGQAPVALQHYGLGDIQFMDRGLDGWQVSYKGEQFGVRCVGRHLLSDVVGAIKVGTELGATPTQIAHALEGFEPMHGRSSVHRSDVTIIDDSYNASLDSTSSILSYVSSLSWQGSKKVVLGPMKELGSCSEAAHQRVARQLSFSSIRQAHLYGKEMESAYRLLKHSAFEGTLSYTDDFEELGKQVTKQTEHGDLYLIKASRSLQLERLIPSIQEASQRRIMRA